MNTTGTQPDIEIIFEDNHLLVINKPPGVLSQEDYTGDPDVLTICKTYLKQEYNKPGKVFLGLVHRLDKPVSGVMVLARTSKAASRISEQIRRRTLKKTYLAVVNGSAPENGYLQHFLVKDNRTNTTRVTGKNTRDARKAVLSFEKIGDHSGKSLLRINLITGRAHQIRVQLSEHGYPISGDSRYGTSEPHGICLHAYEIEFSHPTLRESVRFNAKPPKTSGWKIFHSILND